MTTELTEWEKEAKALRGKFTVSENETHELIDKLNDRIITLIHRLREERNNKNVTTRTQGENKNDRSLS